MLDKLKHWLAGEGLQVRLKAKSPGPRSPRPGRPARAQEQACPHCGEPMLAAWGTTCGSCRPGLTAPRTLNLSVVRPAKASGSGLALGWLVVMQTPDEKRQGTLIDLGAPLSVLSRGARSVVGQEWFDGRDFADPTGEQPADFVALADELARVQVRLLLVSFPAPEGDAEQSARNLAALVGTGLQRVVEQPGELQSALESLGQVLAELRQVRLEVPWWWRTWGGTHRLRLNLLVNGKSRAIEVGKVSLPPGRVRWVLVSGGLFGMLLLVGVAWLMRARPRKQTESLLDAASDLIEQGITARRAIINLSRRFPKEVGSLVANDPSVLAQAGYPALQTRAGQRRFQEMVALLKRGDEGHFGDDLASALAQVIAENLPAERAAERLRARIAEDELLAFSRLGLQPLASALRKAGSRHPVLLAPRSRALALAIQEALRLPQAPGPTIGWLVRAAGPGKRGESLCLGKGRVLLGRSANCDLRLEADTQIAQEQAVISEERGQLTIEPLQAPVKVEDQVVNAPHPLHDGDTIEMGESRFVWKCVAG